MEIIDRKENSILNRVELSWQWRHTGAATPTRAEIIDAVNESVDTTKCRGAGDCQGGEICLTHHLWEDLSDQIHSFLQSISLADLVTKNEVKQISENQDQRQIRMNDCGGELRLPASSL